MAKSILGVGLVVGTTAFFGRPWTWVLIGALGVGVLIVHGWWLPKNGVNGWTGEPRACYRALIGLVSDDKRRARWRLFDTLLFKLEPRIDARAVDFLRESSAIEGITNIDYGKPDNQRTDSGHAGAFFASQRKAVARESLTVADLCAWQRLIVEEQGRFGHPLPEGGIGVLRSPEAPINVRVGTHTAPSFGAVPPFIDEWLRDLNARLDADEVEIAAALGDFFQRFEAIHPFADGNGRTGRLVANYIATHSRVPIIVFRAEESPAFYEAHRSKLAMRVFMASKLREAAYSRDGQVLSRVGGDAITDRYGNEGATSLIVDCRTLVAAQRLWQGEALRKGDSRA